MCYIYKNKNMKIVQNGKQDEIILFPVPLDKRKFAF